MTGCQYRLIVFVRCSDIYLEATEFNRNFVISFVDTAQRNIAMVYYGGSLLLTLF